MWVVIHSGATQTICVCLCDGCSPKSEKLKCLTVTEEKSFYCRGADWHMNGFGSFELIHASQTLQKTDNVTVYCSVPWLSRTPPPGVVLPHTHLHHVHCGIWPHQRQHGDSEAPGRGGVKSLIGDEGGWREVSLSPPPPPPSLSAA